MRPKKAGSKVVSVLLSTALFILGLSAAYFLGIGIAPVEFGMHPSIGLVLLSSAVVLLSMLFFGYLSPIVMLAFGLMNGAVLAANPVVVVLLFIPVLMASYVGTMMGRFLYADLRGEDSLFEHKGLIISRFVAALVVAAAFGFILATMQQGTDILALVRGLVGV